MKIIHVNHIRNLCLHNRELWVPACWLINQSTWLKVWYSVYNEKDIKSIHTFIFNQHWLRKYLNFSLFLSISNSKSFFSFAITSTTMDSIIFAEFRSVLSLSGANPTVHAGTLPCVITRHTRPPLPNSAVTGCFTSVRKSRRPILLPRATAGTTNSAPVSYRRASQFVSFNWNLLPLSE